MARLAFLGTPVIAVPSLEALVDAGHEIVLVVSRPDARRGRGKGKRVVRYWHSTRRGDHGQRGHGRPADISG